MSSLACHCGVANVALGKLTGRHHLAIDEGLGRGEIHIGAASQGHFRLAGAQGSDALAAHHAIDSDQDLDTVADGEDRLSGLVEMPDQRLHPLVDADIFRPAAAGTVDGVVFGKVHFGEGLVDVGEVAVAFDIGLVPFEIVQRGLYLVAGLLVGTDDMDGVTDRLHPLLEDEDFIFLGEFAGEHEDFDAEFVQLAIERHHHVEVVRRARILVHHPRVERGNHVDALFDPVDLDAETVARPTQALVCRRADR